MEMVGVDVAVVAQTNCWADSTGADGSQPKVANKRKVVSLQEDVPTEETGNNNAADSEGAAAPAAAAGAEPAAAAAAAPETEPEDASKVAATPPPAKRAGRRGRRPGLSEYNCA